MTRKDLKDYKGTQRWISDRLEYIEELNETISRITAVISDMPKGGKNIYDREAENLAKLNDNVSQLMTKIAEQQEKQKEIVDNIERLENPYNNILFEIYILGKPIVTVASEQGYNYKYTCELNGKALKLFEELDKSG